MRQWVHHIWLVLLTGMLVLGIGLRGLPAPCQNGLCGTGGCATSATPCPPSCTCHWSNGPDGDLCCHPASHGQHAHHDPAVTAVLTHHGHAHGMPDPAVDAHQGHDHAQQVAMTRLGHAHGAHAGTSPHADGATAAAPSHCAPGDPAADDPWPNLSLPQVQPPALLAAGLALDLFTLPPTATTALPAVAAWAQPPPIRPPAA
jgi:hypothetical protein